MFTQLIFIRCSKFHALKNPDVVENPRAGTVHVSRKRSVETGSHLFMIQRWRARNRPYRFVAAPYLVYVFIIGQLVVRQKLVHRMTSQRFIFLQTISPLLLTYAGMQIDRSADSTGIGDKRTRLPAQKINKRTSGEGGILEQNSTFSISLCS